MLNKLTIKTKQKQHASPKYKIQNKNENIVSKILLELGKKGKYMS